MIAVFLEICSEVKEKSEEVKLLVNNTGLAFLSTKASLHLCAGGDHTAFHPLNAALKTGRDVAEMIV